MIPFTRVIARDFRALFARCATGRPRGPAPPVLVAVTGGTRTVCATTPEGVALAHTAPAPREPDDRVVLPSSVLADVEGGTDDPVTLDRASKGRGVLRWAGAGGSAGGAQRSLPVDLIVPGAQHAVPARPVLAPVSGKVLAALAECGRAAARASGRYALAKVQVRGRLGQVIGTDGRAALLARGFTFPFADDVLVPAVAAFAAPPLARAPDVKLGRTATHLVVAAGPWAVWLPTDTTGKYPDVAAVVPRHAPTTVTVDDRDAADLVRALPGLPGGDHELRPVTLEATRVPRVRGATGGGAAREVALVRSAATGPAVRAVLDRRVLARALGLGCRTVQLTPQKPVAFAGPDRTLVAVQLDPDLAAPGPVGAHKHRPEPAPEPVPERGPAHVSEPVPDPVPERSTSMRPQHPSGRGPAAGPGSVPAPAPDPESLDPLTAAEELRAALAEASARAARLVAALRAGRKEKRALASVFAGLKQLNLATPASRV